MPTFARKTLRQDLTLNWLRDGLVGNTALSLGATATVVATDSRQANMAFSGRGLHADSWMLLASVEYRVASFNAPSGGFVTLQNAVNAIPSGADFEVHHQLSPTEKNQALDHAIRRIRTKGEVGISAIDGLTYYPIETAGSPHRVLDVLDVYYFANAASSLNRDKRHFHHWEVKDTPTGSELRILPALAASQQIVMEALLQLTLGAGDTATVNLPDADWVLSGAAVRCYDILIRNRPGKEIEATKGARNDAAREFSRLSRQLQPIAERNPALDDWI